MNDLEGLLEEVGIRLGHATDDEVFGYCPGHKEALGREDRRPRTWSVNRVSGQHFCFSCGYGGGLTDLILDRTKMTYWSALKMMRDFGVDLTDPEGLPETYHAKPKQAKVSAALPDTDGLDQFVPPPAQQLKRRHLSAKSAAYYDVLWDPDLKCWITPIKLVGGALLGWQAKNQKMFDNYPAKVTKQVTLFGIDKFDAGTTAILVESPLDVVRLHTVGYEGGLAAFGVAVSDDQMRLVLSLTDEVILALDNADDGRRWTNRLITGNRGPRKPKGVAWGAKFNMSVINYNQTTAKDPGEMTADEIDWAIDNAIPSYAWEA